MFMIDSLDLNKIKELIDSYPIDGITCNPTILKKSNIKAYEELKLFIEKLDNSMSFHIQVSSKEYEKIINDANYLREILGDNINIKIPVNKDGIKAIKQLSSKGCHITATAIYDAISAIMAIDAGAEYVAVYVNRMENNYIDYQEVISSIKNYINNNNLKVKIIGASYKNLKQVVNSINAGCDNVTLPVDLFDQIENNVLVSKAIDDFVNDYGEWLEG